MLNLMRCVGSKTGAMLPSGRPQDEIDGVPVTLIDVAMPMMVVRAESLGKTGYETPAELDADTALFARVERMRRTADGEIRRWCGEEPAPTKKGGAKAKCVTATLNEVKEMRPTRTEIIVCTGLRTPGGQ